MAAPADAQKQLQTLSDDYQQIQRDLQSSVAAREKLEAQQQENLGVQKEFKGLSEDSNIYKLIGSVLLKQERAEATVAVDGRLEYIGGEIGRVEAQLKALQEKSDNKKMEIYQLQGALQQQEESPAQAQVAA